MKGLVICLIGPTAAGKSEVALALAKRIDAEIISCDSMQIYQEIDIAASKPTKKQRKALAHHLVDILRPAQEYNAARFRTSAKKIINEIHQRGKVPLIVGGTGLYLRALLDGLFMGPGQSVSLRKRFYQQAQKYGRGYLYKRLKKIDPLAANTIHQHDLRRIVRALEVYQKSGIPISRLQKKACGIRDKYELRIFGLKRPRAELYARIEQRVEQMFRRGVVEEVKQLGKVRMSKTIKSLLGYKEIAGWLNGEYSKDEAKRLLKRNTRHYAKRQISWFKREKGVKWVEVGTQDTPKFVTEKILAMLSFWQD